MAEENIRKSIYLDTGPREPVSNWIDSMAIPSYSGEVRCGWGLHIQNASLTTTHPENIKNFVSAFLSTWDY